MFSLKKIWEWISSREENAIKMKSNAKVTEKYLRMFKKDTDKLQAIYELIESEVEQKQKLANELVKIRSSYANLQANTQRLVCIMDVFNIDWKFISKIEINGQIITPSDWCKIRDELRAADPAYRKLNESKLLACEMVKTHLQSKQVSTNIEKLN